MNLHETRIQLSETRERIINIRNQVIAKKEEAIVKKELLISLREQFQEHRIKYTSYLKFLENLSEEANHSKFYCIQDIENNLPRLSEIKKNCWYLNLMLNVPVTL